MAFNWAQKSCDEDKVVEEFFKARTDFYVKDGVSNGKHRRRNPQVATQAARSPSPARLSPLTSSPTKTGNKLGTPPALPNINPDNVGIRQIAQLAKQMNMPVRMAGIQEAKNITLRMAEGSRKEQYAWLSTLASCDNFFSSAYEYMTAFFVLKRAIEKQSVVETVQLNTQYALCEFGSSYFKLLLEVSRRGEHPLEDLNDADGLIQVVFKMCCAVVQISFSEEQRPAVERELTRILSKADFTIEHDVELFLSRKHAQRSAKEMYREAMISFGARLSSPELAPLARDVRETVRDLLHAEGVWLWLVDERKGLLWNEELGNSQENSMFIASAGIVGSCALTKEAIAVWDVQHDSRLNRTVDSMGPNPTQCCLAIPLMLPDLEEDNPEGKKPTCMGVLYMANKKSPFLPRFSEEDQIFGGLLSPVLAQAINNSNIANSIAAKNILHEKQIRVTNDIANAMTSPTVRDISQIIATVLQRELKVAGSSLFMVDSMNERIWRAGSAGGSPSARPESDMGPRPDIERFAINQGIVGHTVEHGEAMIVSDLAACQFFDPEIDAENQSLLPTDVICIPIRAMECLMMTRAAEAELLEEQMALEEQKAALNTLAATVRKDNPRRVKQEMLVRKLDQAFTDSQIKVRLLAKKGVLGALELINKDDGTPFTVLDREFLMAIEDVISGALASISAKELAEQNIQQSKSLADICQKLTSELTGEPPLAAIVEQLKNVMDVEETTIFLADELRPKEFLRVSSNPSSIVKQDYIGMDSKSIVMQCYENGQVYNIDDAKSCAFFNRKVDRSSVSDVNTYNVLAIPYRDVHGTIVGVLEAVNKRMQRLFHLEDELAMQMFAKIAHTAISNSAKFSAINEEARSCSILVRGMQHLSGSLVVEDVLHDVIKGIKELVHADHAFLFLRTNDVIQLQLSSNDTHLEHLIRADGSEKVWGFPGHSCFHHDTICLSGAEITSDQRYSAVVDSLIGYEPSGLVSIPILDPASLESDEVRRPALGVIEVVNEHMSGRKFTQKDVAMLQSFIKLLAITVKNAQHHDVQVETCDGIRVTCDRLDHSRDILFQLETDQMLTRVCDVAKSHLDAHQASLFVLDPETLHKRRQEHGLYRAGTDTQAGEIVSSQQPANTTVGRGLVGLCALKSDVLLVAKAVEDERSDDSVDSPVDGSIAGPLLCAPCLDSNGEVNGVIHVIRSVFGANRDLFTNPDGDFLRRLGILVGVCIENSRKYTWLRASHDLSRKLLSTQYNLTAAVARDAAPESLPFLVIQEAMHLFEASAVLFFRYDVAQNLIFRYGLDPGNMEQMDAVGSCPPWGIVGEAIMANDSRLINDVIEYRKKGSIHEVFDPDVDCPTALCATRAILCAPIKEYSQEEDKLSVVGALSIILDSSTPRKFSQGEQHCLEMWCSYIASFMCANTSARDALIPSAEELEAMLQFADLDGSQTLNSEDEMFLMAKQLCMKCGIHTATRELVMEHAVKAEKVSKEWGLDEFVEYFMQSKDKHYKMNKIA